MPLPIQKGMGGEGKRFGGTQVECVTALHRGGGGGGGGGAGGPPPANI